MGAEPGPVLAGFLLLASPAGLASPQPVSSPVSAQGTGADQGSMSAEKKHALGVVELIEARRLLATTANEPTPAISPDGTRYFLLLKSASVERDEVLVDVFVGGLDGIESAVPRQLVRLRSRALGNFAVTSDNRFKWVGDTGRIAYLWEDAHGRVQIFAVDSRSGEIAQLTDHPTSVVGYDISDRGEAIAFTALVSRDDSESREMQQHGFTVREGSLAESDVFSFLRGDFDGGSRWDDFQLFVKRQDGGEVRRVVLPENTNVGPPYEPRVAPDGTRAAIPLRAKAPPAQWAAYTQRYFATVMLPAAARNPENSLVIQTFIVDTRTALAAPLWDAPASTGASLLWSPDSTSILVGPTFLPLPRASGAELDGRGFAVIDLSSGQTTPLSDQIGEGRPIKWDRRGIHLEPSPGRGHRALRRIGRRWQASRQTPDAPSAGKVRVKLEIRESLNSPPVLVAIDAATGTQRRVLEIDDTILPRYRLGHVEATAWRDEDGVRWSGHLYRPVQTAVRRPVAPVVVQTYLHSPKGFSLIGDEMLPSVFAAQVLANRGIAVLQMGRPESRGLHVSTPEELSRVLAGVEGAVAHLETLGFDSSRLGITGFSRSGLYVEHVLTHSDHVFAAAVVADNYDASYHQALYFGLDPSSELHGSRPFGEGLEAWLERAPGFNVDRIRTPLRLQAHSSDGFPLSAWEMFSRLKQLNAPVELYAVPDMGQGTHSLQNPRQLHASLDGVVDWFDFWLNDSEDASPAQEGRFREWRRLREQRDSQLDKPRRALLEWHASPRR